MDKIQIPSYETLKEIIPSIDDSLSKYLIAFTYAGCARIGEIVRPDTWHAPSRKGEPSLKEDNIYMRQEDRGLRLYLQIKTTKRKSGLIERNIPIHVEKEKWLCSLIQNWLQEYEAFLPMQKIKNYQEGELFPFNPSCAYKRIKTATGLNPHKLRGARATHYLRGDVTGKPMSLEFVAKIGGWSNVSTLSKYYSGVVMDDVSAAL
jgi:hypothetical protein